MPSAVFISITGLPFVTLTVAAPFSYEPPAIPIFAALRVSETSVNTGAAAGNDFVTATLLSTPLTENTASVGFAKAAGACAGAFGAIEGVTPAAAVFGFDEPLDDVAHELPSDEVVSLPHAVAICCLNGSLLLNRLNEISCPALGGSGLVGSETPSGVVEVARGADTPSIDAVAEPSSEGGASGWVPDGVVLDDTLELELELELWL